MVYWVGIIKNPRHCLGNPAYQHTLYKICNLLFFFQNDFARAACNFVILCVFRMRCVLESYVNFFQMRIWTKQTFICFSISPHPPFSAFPFPPRRRGGTQGWGAGYAGNGSFSYQSQFRHLNSRTEPPFLFKSTALGTVFNWFSDDTAILRPDRV